MAQEQGYRQQVGTPAPVNLPGASPEAFGAGVGRGIEQVGAALQNADLRQRQLDRQQRSDSEAADFASKFATIREAADKASVDMRTAAAPGGAGHAEQTAAWWEQQKAGLLNGITEDRVRRSAAAQLDEFGSRFRSAEYQWQEGARVGKLVTDTKSATDIAANRAYRSHDPSSFSEELNLGRQSIEAMTGVPADVREKLLQNHDETVSIGFLNGVVDTNPAAVAPLLDSGQFDGLLSPQQADRLRNGAHAELRSREAQARAQAGVDARNKRDELGATENTLNAGAGTYQDRVAIAGQYEALGDKSKAEEWKGKATAFAAVQGSRDWTLPDMDKRIAELTAKQGGKGLSGAEAHELNGLKDQRSASAARLNDSGGALLQQQYATGRVLAPIDPADPASMQARARSAIAAAGAYGRNLVEPILPTELQSFKDLMGDRPGDKLRALDAIRGFGDPRAIAGAARQIAGADDGDMRIAATLGHEVARDVLRGGDTLRGNPTVWNERQAAAVMQTYYRRTLTLAGQGYADDVMAAAKNFYAERMTRAGETKWNPGRFAESIETVMGRTLTASGEVRGGVARMPQGIVIVPPSMAPQALMNRFARSRPQDYAKAAGGRHPRWANGAAMTERQFKQLLPTAMAGGRYGFRGPDGGLIEDDQGDIYSVDIGALGR